MTLLKEIQSPADLKKIAVSQLPQLAQEIREFLIESVSQTGGHLGPSLGVVELTMALHYTFSTPKDKLVWDVGHQAYTHKILTGRKEQFSTLRQHGGISGFPHTTESEHDSVTVGHASTSISAALGIANARDLRGQDGEVVAIIGDGSLTGGLAFEGLNNLGHSHTRMTVILNDNEMSIAPNVGAMSKYLTKIITDKKYNNLKSSVWNSLDHLSTLGKNIQSAVHNLEGAVKKVITPGSIFEDLGLRYIGPVDGHNLEELLAVLKFARDDNNGPLLIHVMTKKGRGYSPAEENQSKFHGLGAFERQTGNVISSETGMAWSTVFGNALEELAEKDPTVVAVTAAMPDGTGLGSFRKKFPKRLFDVGIAEGHAVTFAAGLALNGIKPVVAMYSTFLQRAYDNIIHDVALDNLSVVFAIDRAGVVGSDGPTHHGSFDLSYLRTIPNVTILAPSCAQDLRDMLKSALYDIPGPVFIRYPRGNAPGADETVDASGRAAFLPQLCREGSQVLLLSVGHFFPEVCHCADILADDGISVAVVDAKTVKPLEKEWYCKYFSTYKIVVSFEENTVCGGYGSALMELASQLYAEGKLTEIPRFYSFAYPDAFVDQGNSNELRDDMQLSASQMALKIGDWVRK